MDFGEDEIDAEIELEEDDDVDLLASERKLRSWKKDLLRRTAGQPVKPPIVELRKMHGDFLVALKQVLAE